MSEKMTVANEDGRLIARGALVTKQVTSLFKQSIVFVTPHQEICLAGIREIDSAGLALLVHWRNHAKKNGSRIQYVNAPDNVRALAGICGLASMLEG